MRITAKERESRSKQRQSLAEDLRVWIQREKDAEVWPGLNAQERSDKVAFCRQEQEKLQKALQILDRGVAKQRAWADGKLTY